RPTAALCRCCVVDASPSPAGCLARSSRLNQSSAHRFLHERGDPCLFGRSQLLQREGGWPHGAFVEVRLVHEAERRVPRFELLRALEEADDLAVLGIRGHPVPEPRREGWRAGFDDRMEPLAQGAIRFRHRGDLWKWFGNGDSFRRSIACIDLRRNSKFGAIDIVNTALLPCSKKCARKGVARWPRRFSCNATSSSKTLCCDSRVGQPQGQMAKWPGG